MNNVFYLVFGALIIFIFNFYIILQVVENSDLDGASPPVQTVIFENTNYKSAPTDIAMKAKYNNHLKNQKIEAKGRGKCFFHSFHLCVYFSAVHFNAGIVPFEGKNHSIEFKSKLFRICVLVNILFKRCLTLKKKLICNQRVRN